MSELKTLLTSCDAGNKKRPTMDDVAKRARVCRATVSMVMSNDSRIKGETRERVLEAVGLLNYQVNETARALALRKKDKPKPEIRVLRQVLLRDKMHDFISEEVRRDA
jgi:hypothetical protein